MDIVLYAPREPQLLYPDKWTGPAAYKSDIYPDIWDGPAAYTDYLYPDRYRPPSSRKAHLYSSSSTSALQPRALLLPRRHNTMDTHAFNEAAFHARIKALRDLDELEGRAHTRDSENFDSEILNTTPKFSGANDIPLGKIRRIRSSVDEPGQAQSTSKRSQLAPLSSSQTQNNGKQYLIDLTSDDDTPTQPVHPTTLRNELQVTTTRASPSAMEISRTPPPPQDSALDQTLPIRLFNPATPPSVPKLSNPQTVRAFTKVATQLRMSRDRVQAGKLALSKRWELDPVMQTAEVMERLKALNEFYRGVEEGLEGALGVLEGLI